MECSTTSHESLIPLLVRTIAIVLFVGSSLLFPCWKSAQNKASKKGQPPVDRELLAPDKPSESEEFYLLKRVRQGEKDLPFPCV